MPATLTQPKSTSRRKGPSDPTTQYALDVVEGRIVAGRYVRLAGQRHLDDLARDDLTWDVSAAKRAIGFFADCLRLNGGVHEGLPFALSPWEAFIVGSLFGWKTEDTFRRFRVGYAEIAKGNGKSPLAAGIGHLMLSADQEPRAEVYAAATKKDQAMILFRDAVAMREQSPSLKKRLKLSGAPPNVWNMADLATGSFFRPIASDDAQSGPRPHCGLIDELHEHKDSNVVDMMRAGTKGRRQALIFEITNSGFDRHSICRQHHEYSVKVLEGALVDDSWFAYVCALDTCESCRTKGQRQQDCADCDQWTDEAVWSKANPNLGVSITLKYLREQVREALGMPAKQNVVRRLNFCEWTEQDERSIPMDKWALGKAPLDPTSLHGRPCYGGLDLARVNDLSSFDLVFPPATPGEKWKILSWSWVPKDDIQQRAERDRVPYDVWVRERHIAVTPGNTTDYEFITAAIIALAGRFKIQEIAFDRTFAGEIIQDLMAEGLKMVEFGQGFLSMAAPTAEFHRLVIAEQLQHGGNPVLTWAASNLSVALDPAGNMKPDKEHSSERIDPIVAGIMALGRAITVPVKKASIYETRGPVVLGAPA